MLLRVGEIVRGTRGEDILLGNYEGGEAVVEIVEPATNRRLFYLQCTQAEAFVVALSSFECAIDEDVESRRFRRCLLEFPGQSFEVRGDEVGFDVPGVELYVRAALDPGRPQAGGFGSDDVEGIAGDEPGPFRPSLQATGQVEVDLRVRLEGSEIVYADHAFEVGQTPARSSSVRAV